MRRFATILLLLALAAPAAAQSTRAVVTGVGEDMLKLRAGPGTGFRIIVGLPEGAIVLNRGCQQIGGTPWCDVSLDGVRRLRGYVSGHYLRAE